MTLRKRRMIMIFCVLAFLAIAPMVLLYSNGYRLGPGFKLIKTGGMFISSPLSGSQIFIGNDLKKTTNVIQGGLFIQNLKPSSYSILVAKEGYWPWAKQLEVKEQSVTEARAFLVPKDPEGKVVRREDLPPLEIAKYDEIIEELQKIKNLSATSTLIEKFTSNKNQKIWWNPKENKIWAEWLGNITSIPYYFDENEKILVLDSIYPLRYIDFYPGRRDVIVVAVQNAIFALEIDGRGGRNLQPIYKGKEPVFYIYKNEPSVYILDEGVPMEIKLE